MSANESKDYMWIDQYMASRFLYFPMQKEDKM